MITKMMTYIFPPLVNHYRKKKRIPIQKQNKNHTLDPRMQKLPSTKNIAVKTQRYRIISDYGKISKIKMQRKIENHRSPKKNLQNTLKNNRNYHLQT